MTDKQDLLVNGPGSPISLRKVIEEVIGDQKMLSVLLDQDSQGFYTGDADVVVIDAETCSEQAMYFQQNHFNQKQLPLYMVRHLMFFFYYEHKDLVYPHDKYILSDLNDFLGKDEEGKRIYQEMLNKITYLKNNPEWKQIIGLIMCIGGCLNISRNEGKSCKIYIEHPETHLHPKREQLFMSFLHEIYKEYTGLDLQ